jgi:hypothetical protein
MKESINILFIITSIILAIVSGIVSFFKFFLGIILLIISITSLLFFAVKFRCSQEVKKDAESGDVQTGKISLAMEEQKSQQIDSQEQDKELDSLQEGNLIVKKNKPIVMAAKRDLEMLDAKLMKKRPKDSRGALDAEEQFSSNRDMGNNKTDINIKQFPSDPTQEITTRNVMKKPINDLSKIDKDITNKLEATTKEAKAGGNRQTI